MGMTRQITMGEMKVRDNFWDSYLRLVKEVIIPYQLDALNDRVPGAEPSYSLENFRVAAGRKTGTFHGYVFQDSDVYKWLEAVAFSLMWAPDPQLEKTADEIIDLIAAAQQKDGYLDTYYIINGIEQRFTNLRDSHELYCLGHLAEAAIQYYKATGKRILLDVALRYVDCVRAEFGPEPEKNMAIRGMKSLKWR